MALRDDIPANDTAQLQALDKAHHIHPFTDPKSFDERPARIIERGEGCHVWDTDNNKILDGMAGLWCVNMGYGRQELIQAAKDQLETLPYYNTFFHSAAPVQVDLAAKLAHLTPDPLNHIFFANSGSEANDTIIRLVRHYWAVKGHPNRRVFIGRNKAYHGSTLAAASLGGMAAMHKFDRTPLADFAHITEPHWYFHGQDQTPDEYGLTAAQTLEDKIIEIGPENVAAFIGEPVQGAGGVIDPPSSYWPRIEEICRKYGILLISDEVICGFGRTGQWFGCQYYGYKPDVMTMAKGLSSGYQPISAVAFSDEINTTLRDGGALVHGYTYSGHPVAAAVALANLSLMEQTGIVEMVRTETIPYFRGCLNQLADEFPIIGEVRGVGLLGALQLVRDRDTRDVFSTDDNAANICRDYCLEEGLIMRAVEQAMILCPPLVITKSEIDEMVDKAARGLQRTTDRFF